MMDHGIGKSRIYMRKTKIVTKIDGGI